MISGFARDRIRTLRAIGPSSDPLALRLKLERTFAAVDLGASGLPSRAIVCVRRMRVSVPRNNGWADAVNGELRSLAARAARPFDDAVPAAAEAVLFDDETELLACLARDSWRGGLDAWWWRSILGAGAVTPHVCEVLRCAPTLLPAAIERLARRSIAAAVVGSIPPVDCEAIGGAVSDAFAVPGWTPESSPPPRSLQPWKVSEAPVSRPANVARLTAALAGIDSVELAALSPPQRALLSLALVLCRAPAIARVPNLVAVLRTREWLPVVSDPRNSRQVVSAVEPGPSKRTVDRVLIDEVSGEREGRPSQPHGRGEPPAVPNQQPERISPPTLAAGLEGPRALAPALPDSMPEAAGESAALRVSPEVVGRASEWLREVDSEYAGVLYLINVAIHLELYSDFTQPARPGIPLSVGDLLALVGERVCGPGIRADGIWQVLADLAGRGETEPPGVDFEPPGDRDLEGWVDDQVRAFAPIVAAALDQDETDALRFLCCRQGHVMMSLTRLEATFALETHPLAVRIAGLDRDPGWMPSAGRVIAFHFE